MIALVYGTTAELIKLAPVHRRLVEQGSRPLMWCTAQQLDELPEATELLGLPQPDVMLAHGARNQSLRTRTDAAVWLATVVRRSVRHGRRLRARSSIRRPAAVGARPRRHDDDG